METRSTLIILVLALVGVFSAPVPKLGEIDESMTSELLSSTKEEPNLTSTKSLVEDSKLSQCDKSCKVCDATGKLQSDGSCKCYSENGGELVCLKPGLASTRDLAARGERCSDNLGSATPAQLQSQTLTPAQRSLEEFRQRVETLRELTIENMRRMNLLGIQSPAPAIPNTEATLGISALPKMELPKLTLPTLQPPKLSTTLNLPSTLPKLEPIKIPSIQFPNLDARVPEGKAKFQLPTLPKLEINIPKLPSLPSSNLPVSPYLGQPAKEEVEVKEEEKELEQVIVAAPNPEENETEYKNGEIRFNIPPMNLGSQLSSLSLPPLNRRGFLPSGQMNFRIPQFSARFPPSQRISRSSQSNTSSSLSTDKEDSTQTLHEGELKSDVSEKQVKVE